MHFKRLFVFPVIAIIFIHTHPLQSVQHFGIQWRLEKAILSLLCKCLEFISPLGTFVVNYNVSPLLGISRIGARGGIEAPASSFKTALYKFELNDCDFVITNTVTGAVFVNLRDYKNE